MSDYQFEWKGSGLLVDALTKPLKSISLTLDKHGKVETVGFWSHTEGLRIHSEMKDVATRIEVGVLAFEAASQMTDNEHSIPLDRVLTPFKISKLLLSESGKVLESGLAISFSAEQEILVLPSDFPCFLAVKAKGMNLPKTLINLEYPLDRYEVSDMFVAQGA